MLRADKISFAYDRVVVDEISLELKPGELLAVIGPNGSGKSTLVRLLAGLLKPTQGQIEIDNRNLAKISRRELAQLLGYVAQETRVQFPLTAFEFVLQGRFAYGRGLGFEQETDLAIANQALTLTDTAQFYHRYLNALSGGERQRVFLARALAQQPRLLLLDEPTSNLDISHQVSTLKLLHQLTRDRSLGVFLITHELNLAAEFADRILLLKNGGKVALGRPSEVLTREKLTEVFETDLLVDVNPDSGAPRITIKAR